MVRVTTHATSGFIRKIYIFVVMYAVLLSTSIMMENNTGNADGNYPECILRIDCYKRNATLLKVEV